MAEVEIHRTREDDDGWSYRVSVTEAGSRSEHQVSLARSDYERWGGNKLGSPDEFVKRCFDFLLERESKESILSRFDVRQIGSYFPEFEDAIRRMT